jgi:TorA maturation chaperone TorD
VQKLSAHHYLLVAGLFDLPRRDAILLGLAQEVADRERDDVPWRETLDAVIDEIQHPTVLPKALAAEHARLFVLNSPRVPAQPYGSYWLERERRLMGDSSMEVRDLMARHGIRTDPESGLLPDHIVAETEVLAWLLAEDDDTRSSRQALLEHLRAWTPHFTAALRNAEPLPRYRLAADLLDRFIDWDSALVQGQPH